MMITETRLPGRWLTLVRAVWLIIFAIYVGLIVLALPAYWVRLNLLPSRWAGWAEADVLAALAQLQISKITYFALLAVSDVASAGLSFIIGFFIFRRKSDEVMPLLVSFLFISLPAGSGILSFQTLPESHLARTVIAPFNGLSIVFILILLFYLFPDGRFVPRWTRWAAMLWVVLGVVSFRPGFSLTSLVGILGTLVLALTLLIAPVYRYARVSGPLQRHQTQAMVLNLGIGAIALLAVFVLGLIFPTLSQPGPIGLIYQGVSYAAWPIFLLFLPLSFAIAIIRSRLWEIDVIIRRTLQYSVLSGLLGLTYFGLVIILQNLTSAVGGQRSEFITVLSTLAIAALFFPLRNRVQEFIDKRFFRKKYDAQKVLAEFAATCRDETDLDKLVARLAEVIDETLQPEKVSVWIKPTADNGRWSSVSGQSSTPTKSNDTF